MQQDLNACAPLKGGSLRRIRLARSHVTIRHRQTCSMPVQPRLRHAFCPCIASRDPNSAIQSPQRHGFRILTRWYLASSDYLNPRQNAANRGKSYSSDQPWTSPPPCVQSAVVGPAPLGDTPGEETIQSSISTGQRPHEEPGQRARLSEGPLTSSWILARISTDDPGRRAQKRFLSKQSQPAVS